MISVLIPIFNYNVTNLVISLNDQLSEANVAFEIIGVNDASSKFISENQSLSKIENFKLINLEKNIGRSKIRNLLKDKASFDWLLYLDSDVIPANKMFIKTYLNCINSNKSKLYFGGIINKKNKPKDNEMLRWSYGRKREDVNYELRQKKPYQFFLASNFLVHKSIFNLCLFNEDIVKYGYEDFVFSEELRNNGVKITHIDNCVYHLGIDKSDVFLEKTKEAIENLHTLKHQKILEEDQMRILKVAKKTNDYNLTWFFSGVFKLFNSLFEINLMSKRPSLVIFDLYKLSYFCFLKKTKFNLN